MRRRSHEARTSVSNNKAPASLGYPLSVFNKNSTRKNTRHAHRIPSIFWKIVTETAPPQKSKQAKISGSFAERDIQDKVFL